MRQIVKDFQEYCVASLLINILLDILVNNFDLPSLHEPRIGFFQFLFHVGAKVGGDLHNMVLDIFEGFLFIILEIKKNGLCCASSSSPCLDYFYIVCRICFFPVSGLSLQDIVPQRHAIIGFEYLWWRQPCVLRISFCELGLVIIEPKQVLEIYYRWKFTNLEVWNYFTSHLFDKSSHLKDCKDGRKWRFSRAQIFSYFKPEL